MSHYTTLTLRCHEDAAEKDAEWRILGVVDKNAGLDLDFLCCTFQLRVRMKFPYLVSCRSLALLRQVTTEE
ncbi:MAG: hypothetical protein ACOVS5_03640 [Oligoflexus sp.]|jgi:hypothetical protein